MSSVATETVKAPASDRPAEAASAASRRSQRVGRRTVRPASDADRMANYLLGIVTPRGEE